MTRDELTVNLPPEELQQAFVKAAVTLEAHGTVRWFRPGSGLYNEQMRALAKHHGYRIALASVPPIDIVLADATRMAALVDWMVKPGSVVVLHDVGERGRRTVETLEILLPRLQGRGLAVTSLHELEALAIGLASGPTSPE
jgi:peptidoglycan/xylan/chitin deacetylase (PgdA/CDA1 family)